MGNLAQKQKEQKKKEKPIFAPHRLILPFSTVKDKLPRNAAVRPGTKYQLPVLFCVRNLPLTFIPRIRQLMTYASPKIEIALKAERGAKGVC